MLIVTTPTPQKPDEELVWPSDHEFEYSLDELISLVHNEHFYIKKMMPWSVHKDDCKKAIYDCLPTGLNRALYSLDAPLGKSRQIFIELKKRG